MKRLTAIILCILLLGSISVYGTGSALATVSSVSGKPGDTVSVTVTISGAAAAKSVMIVPSYDETQLTLLSGKWLISGFMAEDWSAEFGDAAIAFGENTDINTAVFEMAFKIRTDATKSSASVGLSDLIIKTKEASGSETTVSCQVSSGTVSITLPSQGSSGSTDTPPSGGTGSSSSADTPPSGGTGSSGSTDTPPSGGTGSSGSTDTPTSGGTGSAGSNNPPLSGGDGWSNPFIDVSASDWYYEAIRYVYENGLFYGVSNNEFAPSTTMTRAMFVTVLGRLSKVDVSCYTAVHFSDVKRGEWYAPYVEWANENGIVYGYGEGLFGINDPITIEQATVILARYAEFIGVYRTASKSISGFGDRSNVSDWAVSGMSWAAENGIYTGEQGFLRPTDPASRARIASMLYNADALFSD